MAVKDASIDINPYTSTVPLVQVPPEQMESASRPAQPLEGQFGRKGTGALAIGDAILKGFMQGHQAKEQKKAAQAQATIAAADAATQGAYQKYQDSLSAAGGNHNDPNAKAAYDAYVDTFNKGKAAKAQFVIPEKPPKGQSGQKGKDKKPFGMGGIKDFFEANPHVIPQIALLTMQPNAPGASPQTKAQLQASQSAQLENQREQQLVNQGARLEGAQKIVDQYRGLNDNEFAALPREKQQEYQSAIAIVNGSQRQTAPKLFQNPDGSLHYYSPGMEPQGATAFVSGSQAKPGTPGFYAQQFAKENNIPVDQLSTEALDYIAKKRAYDMHLASSTLSSSTVDVHGNHSATTSHGFGPEPQPPAGFLAIGSGSGRATQSGIAPPPQAAPRMAPPPTAAAAPAPASRTASRMTPPPGRSGGGRAPTLQDARNTEKIETDKANRYQRAQDKYDKALLANAKAYKDDPAAKAQADKRALGELQAEHQGIENWYNGQVHAVGGSVPSDLIVNTPGGSFRFKTKADADRFKREAGIQ